MLPIASRSEEGSRGQAASKRTWQSGGGGEWHEEDGGPSPDRTSRLAPETWLEELWVKFLVK